MAKSKFPWVKLHRKAAPEVPDRPPIWLGNRSNTEYWHPASKEERLTHRLVLEKADEQARRLGIDRREFLASSMGMFTTLAVINQVSGCGGDDGDGMVSLAPDDVNMSIPSTPMGTGGSGDGGAPPMTGGDNSGGTPTDSGDGMPAGGAGGAGGTGTMEDPIGMGDGPSCPYVVPREATCEETQLLSGDEFIMDVQTHSFDDGEWRERNTTYANFLVFLANCTDTNDRLDCFDEDHYGKLMFVDSDTTVSVITSWPAQVCTETGPTVCGLPLSNEGMKNLRDSVNEKALSQRVVNQVQVMPNDRWELQRDVMSLSAEDPEWKAVSWKAYPAWGPAESGIGGAGYFLDDEVGRTFIEHGLSLGVPNFAIHKGLPIPGFDVEHNQPIEIGRVASMYPEANFIIYHSGIGAGTGNLITVGSVEREPFDESIADPRMHTGVNQLIAAMLEAGHGHGSNVYAEMGSAWSNVMNDAVAAQHYIGKLLKYLGPDNIVWGTDSILYGSPQPQIEAFRMFQITPQFQQEYGYPELTPEIKARILGRTAARLFCVEPEAARCRADDTTFARVRRHWDNTFGPRRWTVQEPLGPRTRREFLRMARINIKKGHPGA